SYRRSLSFAVASELVSNFEVSRTLCGYRSEVSERHVVHGAAKIRQEPTPAGKLRQQAINLNNARALCSRPSRARRKHDRMKNGFAWAVAARFVWFAVARTQPHIEFVDFFAFYNAGEDAPDIVKGRSVRYWKRMRDAEAFVITRLMWFGPPCRTIAHDGTRQRHAAD